MAASGEPAMCSVEWWDKAMWATGSTGWKKPEDAQWPFEKNLTQVSPAALDGTGKTALVPLCGDSAVVPFLLDKGYTVIGVEGSDIACEAMRKRVKEVEGDRAAEVASRLTVVHGDFFKETVTHVKEGSVDLVYDRAAFVALPPSLRSDYTDVIAKVTKPGSLMFFEGVLRDPKHSAENVKAGPPFNSPPEEVTKLYTERGWKVTVNDKSVEEA
eukprot:gene9255-14341_t